MIFPRTLAVSTNLPVGKKQDVFKICIANKYLKSAEFLITTKSLSLKMNRNKISSLLFTKYYLGTEKNQITVMTTDMEKPKNIYKVIVNSANLGSHKFSFFQHQFKEKNKFSIKYQ